MKRAFAGVQQLGRALMLPIAVLPIAGLLLRLGQPDLLGLPMLAAAGQAVFSNLGVLFAIGVAVGLARENHGAAGLASVVGYLVATKGAEVLIAVPPEAGPPFAPGFSCICHRELKCQVMDRPSEGAEHFVAAFEVGLKRIQSFVIPAHQNFLWTAGEVRHVNLDVCLLSDAIEPANTLFQQFRIQGQIE